MSLVRHVLVMFGLQCTEDESLTKGCVFVTCYLIDSLAIIHCCHSEMSTIGPSPWVKGKDKTRCCRSLGVCNLGPCNVFVAVVNLSSPKPSALSFLLGHALQDLYSRPASAGWKMSCVKRQRWWSRDVFHLLHEGTADLMISSAKGIACTVMRSLLLCKYRSRENSGTDDIFQTDRCRVVNRRRSIAEIMQSV
jgi:hypothetical protein